MKRRLVLALLPLPFVLACPPPAGNDGGSPDAGASADDAGAGDDGGGGPPPPPDAGVEGPAFEHTDLGGGVTSTRAHSVSSSFFLLDLETKAEIDADPATSTAWDLGFSRYHVRSNGGASGPGGVEVAALEPGAFDALTEAPAEGYLVDLEDADLDGHGEYVISVLEPWWDYDETTHVLNATGRVYALKSVEGRYYKLELLDYYQDGESGHPLFRWAEIAPPGGWPDAGPADGGGAPSDAGDDAGEDDAGAPDGGDDDGPGDAGTPDAGNDDAGNDDASNDDAGDDAGA